ncbi:MAG: hypothetical protein AB8F94_17780 [Saprospiraceae bacterium]
MKKLKLLLLCSSLLLVLPFVSSCSKKTGCPVNETVGKSTNRKGDLSTKRGKSNLFPKKMRKKKRG